MMTKDTGGPVFPETHVLPDGDNSGWHGCSGMTLRDYFAAKAMQALFTDAFAEEFYEEKIAEAAYQIADAMLAERSKGN
jgi:hypothetical protein